MLDLLYTTYYTPEKPTMTFCKFLKWRNLDSSTGWLHTVRTLPFFTSPTHGDEELTLNIRSICEHLLIPIPLALPAPTSCLPAD